jgi:multidrug efflux system outer membrane protein
MAGCATVPKSSVQTPTQFSSAEGGLFSSEAAVQAYWQSFGDERLNGLIAQTLLANRDLRAAEARLRQSRSLATQSLFDFGPSGGLTVDHLTTNVSNLQSSTGYGVQAAANWEIDLFGRVRNTVGGRNADSEAALADMHGVRVTVTSETARIYFQLRGATSRLATALANAENQRKTMELTQARYDEGAGSELDVQRARTQLRSTLAAVPLLATQQSQLMNQLAVLLGESPSQFSAPDLLEVQVIKLPELVPVGDPTTWMRRRPDIRRAEARLASAAAASGVSVASLFPKVSLTGKAIGSGAPGISTLADAAFLTTQWGPSLTWQVLNIPKMLFDVKVQNARRDESLANYEQTVLSALSETETAMVAYRNLRQRTEELEAAAVASLRAEELGRVRYEAGASDFLSVLDAQRTQLSVADQLAQVYTDRATALIGVYKALGVGWDAAEAGQQMAQ